MLLHPCECNNRFIQTEPLGLWPSGLVRINLLLHKQGVTTNLFLVEAIHIWTHTNVV